MHSGDEYAADLLSIYTKHAEECSLSSDRDRALYGVQMVVWFRNAY
jgi:hypothetical protein